MRVGIDIGTLRRLPKPLLAKVAVFGLLGLAYFASTRPGYFTSQTYLGGLILLELVAAAIWKFRQVFFTLVILTFLLTGMDLPGSAVWSAARWVLLAVGAGVGFLIMLKERQHQFGTFHASALFASLAAMLSGLVSTYPRLALLKALSLFLLFSYASLGVRLAIKGREARFLAKLLFGCELLVVALAISYVLLGHDVLGNPNSLGAVVGVVALPILLWGALAAQGNSRRRLLLFATCIYLLYYSHSRASMVAAAVSCGLLLIGLRRFRALIAGAGVALMLLTAAAILQPEHIFEATSTVTSDVVYKGFREKGVFESRQTPWQAAVDTIQSHFWFGTGFGTTDKGKGALTHLGNFSSSAEVTTEYGSSYLEIATWVGMLGVGPFFLLLMVLSAKVFRTMSWIFRTRNASHPAIPLAMVVVAGMVHAAFEDWMFAPGYYLCVFFWCLAFLLVDYAPSRATMATQGRP